MDTIIPVSIFIVFCGFAFLEFKLFRRKNYWAFWLGVPYGIIIFWLLVLSINNQINYVIKKIEISEMQYLSPLNTNETTLIALRSKTRFGDGYQAAGGIILEDQAHAFDNILEANSIERPPGMALVWLLDSKASHYRIQGNLLLATDQKQSKKGIWIGWINNEDVEKVKKMDGANL